jgi:WD40 repeat protein
MQRLLAAAAAEWETAGQEPGFLLRGARLDQFEGWVAETDLTLTQGERTFLEASISAREQRQAEEQARRQQELETARQLAETERKRATAEQRRAEEQAQAAGRLRRSARYLAGALLIAAVLAVVAFLASQRASRNAETAEANFQLAATREVVAVVEAEQRATAQAAAEVEAEQRATAQAEAEWERMRADEERDSALAAEATAQAETAIRATAQADAQEQHDIAEQEARAALEAYSLSLSVHARQALDDLDNGTALALALAASHIEDPPKEVIETLKQAAFAPGARRQFSLTDANGEAAPIRSVAVSSDGGTALAGLQGGDIVLLDVESGETLRTFTGHTSQVVNVTFSPDGAIALSGGCDTETILWKVATGEELRRFSRHSGCVYALDFSPDGRRVISGAFASNDPWIPGELFLWDLESGEEFRRLEGGHLYGVIAAAFSPDGGTALSSEYPLGGLGAEYGSPLILWDVESGEIIHRFPAPNDVSGNVAFNPNGGTALSTTANRLYLWDLKTGEELRVFEEHSELMRDVAFSPDGRRAISSDRSGELILWDLASGQPVSHFLQGEAALNGVATGPDGRTVLSGSLDGKLVLWDLFSADEVRRFEGHEGGIADVAFTPDGRQILSAGGSDFRFNVPGVDNSLRLWDVETGEQIQIFEGHTDILVDVKVSPDGRQVLSVSMDGSMRLWDLESGAEIRRFEYPHLLWNASFHPDGRRALASTSEPSLLLWDLETGDILRYFIGHAGMVGTVAFGLDGKRALSSSADGSLILWDVESGAQIHRFWDDPDPVWSLVFSPDDRLAIAGHSAGRIVVWDMETGEALRVFTEHRAKIDLNMVDISPDGRTVVSSDWEGTVLVWDLQSGEILHRFASREALPAYTAFSPDGRFVLVGSQDHSITLWRLESFDLDELREWIETNRVVRELTCDERAQYGIEPLCEEIVEALPAPMPVADGLEVPQRPIRAAQIGENRGEIALGDWDVWLYDGQAGEELTIRLIADNPANDTPHDERIERGLLDTLLFIIAPDGSLLGSNDDTFDAEFATNSLIEGLTLPVDGIYRIEARSAWELYAGEYTLVIESTTPQASAAPG